MANQKSISWDVKGKSGVYKSVSTKIIKKWIKEGKVNKEETFVWNNRISGWRRVENLDEFKGLFKKNKVEIRLIKHS